MKQQLFHLSHLKIMLSLALPGDPHHNCEDPASGPAPHSCSSAAATFRIASAPKPTRAKVFEFPPASPHPHRY